MRFQRTSQAAIIKIKVINMQSTWKRIFWRFEVEFIIFVYFNAILTYYLLHFINHLSSFRYNLSLVSIRSIRSRLRGHFPILGKKFRCPFRGKISWNSFAPLKWLLYYLHASWALLEKFEILKNFDHIFTLLLSLFRPLKVVVA